MGADRRGRVSLPWIAAVLSGMVVLSGCGDDATSRPEGWHTLSAGPVRVDYPERFDLGEKVTGTDAAAVAELEHVIISAVSVYLKPVDPRQVDELFGAKSVSAPRPVDVPGTSDAWRMTYRLDAIDPKHPPVKGTVTTGMVITGENAEGVGFTVRVDGVKGALSAEERRQIADSVRWEG